MTEFEINLNFNNHSSKINKDVKKEEEDMVEIKGEFKEGSGFFLSFFFFPHTRCKTHRRI